MSVIGEAIVKVKIDTSGAKVDLDAKDREERTERDKRQRDRRKKEKKPGGRLKRVPFALSSSRAAVRAVPFVGLAALYAQFGPATWHAVLAFGDQLAGGKLPLPIRESLEWIVGRMDALGGQVDEIVASMSAGFGALNDTTQIAKAGFLFREQLSGEDMADLISGLYRVRQAQGLGRKTEVRVGRRLLGEGLGAALGKHIKMWE